MICCVGAPVCAFAATAVVACDFAAPDATVGTLEDGTIAALAKKDSKTTRPTFTATQRTNNT